MPTLLEANDAPAIAAGSAVLETLCLDFRSKRETFEKKALAFLKRHRHSLDLHEERDLLAQYLDRLWPNTLPGSMIVSNIALGDQPMWLIRPPVKGPLSSRFASGSQAPAFRVIWREGQLVVTGFEVTPHVPLRPFELLVTGQFFINTRDVRMAPTSFTTLEGLPSQRQAISQELSIWQDLLNWQSNLVRLAQVAFRYESFEVRGNDLVFLVRQAAQAPKDLFRRIGHLDFLAAPLEASQSQDHWQPHPEDKTNFLAAGGVSRIDPISSENGGNIAQNPSSILLTLTPSDPDTLEELAGELPAQGFLVSCVGGDLKPFTNQRWGLDRLRNSQSWSPQLPYFLFDIRKAAIPETIPDVFKDLLPVMELNEEQRQAVNKALAAPDIALLQGPPGTGKTAVIIALTLEVTRRGGRVLIASQTHMAVDNVLTRLPRMPWLFPVRIGKPDRIEEGGRLFLPGQAQRWWCVTLKKSCRDLLLRQDELERDLRTSDEGLASLGQILTEALDYRRKIDAASQTLHNLENQKTGLLQAHRQVQQKIERTKQCCKILQAARQWFDHPQGPFPGEELPETTVLSDVAKSAVTILVHTVPTEPWLLPWLTSNLDSSGSTFGILSRLNAVLSACERIKPLIQEGRLLCEGSHGVSSDPSANLALQALRMEKLRLADSDRQEDITRLVQLNRQIKDLADQRWSDWTRRLRSELTILFQGPIAEDLENLTCSLNPENRWIDVLERLSHFTEKLEPALGPHFHTKGFELGQRISGEVERLTQENLEHQRKMDDEKATLSRLEEKIEDERQTLAEVQHHLQGCLDRWNHRWPSACQDLPANERRPPVLEESSLQIRRQALQVWKDQHAAELTEHRHHRPLREAWLRRLEGMNDQDYEALNAYLPFSNVVAITCHEAGNLGFYTDPDFQPFDLVIIDEVSKATPPELLMPMLLGQKVLLVGDYRQLFPMLRERESSFADALAEGRIRKEDFARFGNLVTAGYFQHLFESAPSSIKHSLVHQYRMHEQIMTVVNEFYDGELKMGLVDPKDGEHHLTARDIRGGLFLEPHQHVLWIDSTRTPGGMLFVEQQRGSSKANPLEARLTVETLGTLNQALLKKGYGRQIALTVENTRAGQTVRERLRQEFSEAAPETLDDLFKNKRIGRNGQTAAENERLAAGDTLTIDARKSVAVISFYGAQIQDIQRRIGEIREREPSALAAMDLRCNTVDRFQGMESAIVIVSLVRARSEPRLGEFVKQFQRINVAFSRARQLLVIIGAVGTFAALPVEIPLSKEKEKKSVSVYRNIYHHITQFGGRRYAGELLR